MAFKWTDRVDGQDAVLADDVNTLAAGIKENIDNLTAHKNTVIIDHPDGSITHEKLADGIIENNNISDGAVSKNKLSEGLNTTIDVLVKKVFYDTPASWADVQKIVRSGEASTVFSIGDQFVSHHATYGDLVWDVIGFDHDTPADHKYTHSMTLQLHDVLETDMYYDAPEYTWYIDKEMAAGTYNFTLPAGYDTGYGGGATYQFTTMKTVPAGGVIQFDWKRNTPVTDCKIETRTSNKATSAYESNISVTLGSEGVALPALYQKVATTNANALDCSRNGSNVWATSNIRQWLNSNGEANAWWQPQNAFDKAPTYANKAGFLNGLDPEFLAVIGDVEKVTEKNIAEGYGLVDSTERFFLLSITEVYGGIERGAGGTSGSPYAYYGSEYSDLADPGEGADTNRIKYKNGVAVYLFLRTPTNTYVDNIRSIYKDGSVRDATVLYPKSIAPACCIV